MLRTPVATDSKQTVPRERAGTPKVSVVWVEAGEEVGPRDPEYEAYLKRAERNQRYRCSYCNAFITKQQADACWRWTDYGNEWDPECPPGKGCMRR